MGKFKLKYTKNENYFSDLSLQSSYWAGFIAADGNILYNKYSCTLRIKLADKDFEHLEKFKEHVNTDYPIRRFKDKKGYLLSEIGIWTSLKWCNDLKEIYNITPNKTFTLQPPNLDILPKENQLAYLIGYIDGDGCVNIITPYGKKSSYLGLSIIGGSLTIML